MGSALSRQSSRDGEGVSLRARLRAWWEGEAVSARPQPAGDADDPDSEAPDLEADLRPMRPAGTPPRPARAGSLWTAERRRVAQSIWGDGFVLPGGGDYVLDLASALSLDEGDPLLLFGPGMGGSAAALVERLGVSVTSYQRDDVLRGMAQKRALALGMDAKARFEDLTDPLPALRDSFYRAALLRETLCTVEDKANFLAGVAAALEPEGRLVIADLLFDADADTPELQRWRETELVPVHQCTVAEVRDWLEQCGVATRDPADDSALYRTMALDGWVRMLGRISEGFDRSLALPLLEEATLWARRIAAIDAGALRYVRFTGVKAG